MGVSGRLFLFLIVRNLKCMCDDLGGPGVNNVDVDEEVPGSMASRINLENELF